MFEDSCGSGGKARPRSEARRLASTSAESEEHSGYTFLQLIYFKQSLKFMAMDTIPAQFHSSVVAQMRAFSSSGMRTLRRRSAFKEVKMISVA